MIWAHFGHTQELKMATIRKRNAVWQVIIRRQGFPKQSKVFSKKDEAIQWSRKIEHQIDQGNRIDFKRAEHISVKAVIDDYLVKQENGANRREQSALLLIRQYFGDYALSQITPSNIARFRDTRLTLGRSPATVIKDMNMLSKVLKIAQTGWGVYLGHNPFSAVPKPKVVGHRVRRLTAQEELLLVTKTTLPMRAMIIFAIETGMRLGEILSLKYSDIQNDVAVLKETKNNEIRYVPLSLKVKKVLQSLPKSLTDNRVFCFWKTVSGFESSWQRFKKRENIVDLRFHDLRHEAISRLFEKGFNHMEVSAISGHKSLLILRKYTHLNIEYLRSKLAQ
jgi:integrase